MSAPMDILPTLAESGEPAQRPGSASGSRPPAGPPPASTPPRGGRRSIDGGGRRSIDGSGNRRGRHTVEVPEGAERHEGLVVSRQDKFGFIKCSTHEGRYFFHVNDSDGQAAYGSTVGFVIAKDLTTGKDVAYQVKTLAGPPNSPRAGGTPRASASGSGSTTPRRGSQAGALAAAEGSGFFASGAPSAAAALGTAINGSAGNGSGSAPGGEAAAAGAAAPTPSPQHQLGGNQQGGQHQRMPPPGGPSPQQFPGQHGGPQQHPGGRRQQHQGHGPEGQGPQFGGQGGQGGQFGGRAPYNQYGGHRQPSPASQRDWRLPREQGQPGQMGASPGHMGGGHGGHPAHPSRHSSTGGGASADPSSFGGAPGGPPAEPAQPLTYRGTVAQPARAGRQHGMDDGLLLYIDEQGAQQQARYGNCRLAEGTHRLEAGDVVEFELASYPGAGHGHRKFAADVRFLSKSLLPSPSLEAAVAASESGDSMRGRQLGRVALLKKEFGFIRQMERPGDMFFHFSQLEGWGADDVKVGDDVEYTIRRDRDGSKLSAVQIRRAAPGSVVFEMVGEELLRGVVLERPQLGKQYAGTSGVLEYTLPEGEAADADSAGGEAAIPGAPGYGKARLPFAPQDVAQGSGSLRVGDHVTFRLLTNLQAVKAAALASVPGAAAYAGKRAVEVTFVRYAGLVVQTNKERQFGFIAYGEDQLLPPGPLHGAGASGEGGEGEGAAPAAATAAEPAAAAEGEAKAAAAPAQPAAAAEGEAKEVAPAAAAEAAPAAAEPAAAAAAEESSGGVAAEASTGGSAEGAAEAAPAPAAPQAKRNRIFFHFKEVAGQYVLKQGDEVVFVMHSNLKSGELNAQRVRRTKEGPELPPPPEPAPKPAPVPAVNPNRQKYSGNLQTGGYRQPKIAKGPDGTRGFELPRLGAVMPPLPGLEPKPEEPEEDEEAAAEEAAAAAQGMDVDAASAPVAAAAAAPPGLPPPPPPPADAAVAVAPAPPAPEGPAAGIAPGLSLAQVEAKQAHAVAVKGAAAAVRAAPDGAAAVVSPSWQGSTPFSALAAMTLADASLAEADVAKLQGLGTHLSAEAPVFIPVNLSSGNLAAAAGVDEASGSDSAAAAAGDGGN